MKVSIKIGTPILSLKCVGSKIDLLKSLGPEVFEQTFKSEMYNLFKETELQITEYYHDMIFTIIEDFHFKDYKVVEYKLASNTTNMTNLMIVRAIDIYEEFESVENVLENELALVKSSYWVKYIDEQVEDEAIFVNISKERLSEILTDMYDIGQRVCNITEIEIKNEVKFEFKIIV